MYEIHTLKIKEKITSTFACLFYKNIEKLKNV